MDPSVVGIVAEYNPLHNGHVYQLEQARRLSLADFVVVAMSGDFVQRGEPALLDKWDRARLAVEAGADLVVELPTTFALSSAGDFAKGGVDLLRKLGATHIAFGTESEDSVSLQQIALLSQSEPPKFKQALLNALEQGQSFAKAYADAVGEILGAECAELLSGPNNILAIEYLKNKGDLVPVMVPRNPAFASGRQIREQVLAEGVESLTPEQVPPYTYEFLVQRQEELGTCDKALPLIRQQLLTLGLDDLAAVPGVTEGLEHRFMEYARYGSDYEELVTTIKSKRYTYAAISRMLMNILIGIDKEDVASSVDYAHILAVGQRGRELLRSLQNREDLPIRLVTEVTGDEKDRGLKLDGKAADVYNVLAGKSLYENCDPVRHPYIENTHA